ncbi:MAG: hypothetical protein AAGJ87_07025, partial [Pseudomonadota bacterium]
FACGAAYGVSALTIYGLAIAHGNDRAEPDEYVSLNATLLFVFGGGAILGPIIGPLAMSAFGPSYLFVHTGVIYATLAVFTVTRTLLRDRPAEAKREPFEPVPRTTPAVFEFDPRTPDIDDDDRANDTADAVNAGTP